MSSIRFISLAGLAILALSSVACAAASPEEEGAGGFARLARKSGSSQVEGPNGSQGNATADAGGSCDGACAHYLACKGADTSENRGLCADECNATGVSSQDLAAFEQTDCATAIAIIEGSSNGNGGSTGTSSGGSKPSECDGCVSDGSSCVWISQSDWGQGPYSGAVSECSSYCCE